MTLKITHRKAAEVPSPPPTSRMSQALAEIMRELTRLAPGMVLVIDTGDANTIRATKALITRAGKELAIPVRHWHSGTEVYATTSAAAPRRKQRLDRANRGDFRD